MFTFTLNLALQNVALARTSMESDLEDNKR